jgi:hypothetical protein
MGLLNELINWTFLPFKALFQWIGSGFKPAQLAEPD